MNFWANETEGQVSLSEQEKAVRNVFVDQYLIDFEPVLACMRIGFKPGFAEDYANRFMSEPYVQARIMQQKMKAPDDELDQEESDKALTLSVLHEAALRGPFSSRVAAASKLASILGMDKPIKSSLELNHRGGVMVVPGTGDIDNWEAEAVKSQSALVDVSMEEA